MKNKRHFARAEIVLRRIWERSDHHITLLSLENIFLSLEEILSRSSVLFGHKLCYQAIAYRACLCGGDIKAKP